MLYKALDISKQAVHQHKSAIDRKMEELCYVAMIVAQVRADHPTMGVRDIYYMMRPEGIGRDRFEHYCRELGLSSVRTVNPCRTTDSCGVIRFPNLLEGFAITGYSVSKRLFTEDSVIPALEMAVRFRKGVDLSGLIFHSDGGGQYYSKKFLELTKKLGFRNSMCLYSWENGKAERVNGVIKNNYLEHRHINSYEELVKEVDRSVTLYNNEKPHIKLRQTVNLI